MKILIYSLNYFPDLIGVGKYTGEMAEWLAEKGYEIRVVAGNPFYPEWSLKKLPLSKKYFWSKESIGGVTIYRCPIWVPSKPIGASRIFHLISFFISSLPIMVFQIPWRCNILISIAPPILVSPIALLIAKLSGAISLLHVQDFELKAAKSLNIFSSSFFWGAVEKFESAVLRRFCYISTISAEMHSNLVSVAPNNLNTFLLCNWINVSKFDVAEPFDYRGLLSIPLASKVVLYSGAMSGKQGLSILASVLDIFYKSDVSKDVFFIFCGNGVERGKLEKSCTHHNNVRFIDLQPNNQFPSLVKMADIHLLLQRDNLTGAVLPSKLSAILSSGKPLIATADILSNYGVFLSQFGLVVPPNDAHSFSDALVRLLSDRCFASTLGAAGRKYALENLDMQFILGNFDEVLKSWMK